MSYFAQNTASCFAILTYSTSSGQADIFSQPWVSGASPQITEATGKGYHTGFATITNPAVGAIAQTNNTLSRTYWGQFRGASGGAWPASDDAWIGYGRGASYVVQSSAGSGFVIDTDRARSIIMRSE